MTANGRCCVFQPFDKGPHDKRYEDTLAPAIKLAGLQPYRVDRDDGAVIPIETLHEEIRSATLCLADVTIRNPNVMYELGFAIASGKDVVIICAISQSDKFPFDIQHRGIIQYASDSASDFEKLKNDISNRIKALLKKQETTQDIASASPMKSNHGLQPHEVAAFAFVMANADSPYSGVAGFAMKVDMEKAGYTKAATQLALIRLTRLGFVEAFEDSDYNHNDTWTAYRLTQTGQDWLLDNADKLDIRLTLRAGSSRDVPALGTVGIGDDDVPF